MQRLADSGVLHRAEPGANEICQPWRAGDIAVPVHCQNQVAAAEHPRRQSNSLLGAQVDGACRVEVEHMQAA